MDDPDEDPGTVEVGAEDWDSDETMGVETNGKEPAVGEVLVPEAVHAPNPEARDDDSDDDVLVKKRKRESDEDFKFELKVASGAADETDVEAVLQAFKAMFFDTRLKPTTERGILASVQKRKKTGGRRKVMRTAGDRERDRIRQEEAQRQAESIEKMLTTAREGKLDMDADGDDEPGVTLDNLSDVIGAEAEPEEQDLDYEEDVRLANKFFGIEEDAETDAVDRLEQQAFQEIAKDEGEVEDALETVIPPEDMKRLYLRKVDERIQKTDLPERYQLQLDSVLWSQNELMEKLFEPGPDNIMQKMTMFIYVRVFRNSIHTPKVITQVLTYIFKFGNEPVFVQRYCMLRDKAEESVTLDDVWNIWNTAFEFLEIYNRREQLKDGLLPVHEAMAEGLYRTITEQNFRFAAATRDSKVGMARRVEDGLDSLSYDMYNVSFAELSTKSGQNKWTWLPHYLTWMEKWITHWDDLFTRVCSKEKTQVAYRMNTERTRIPVRRNDAVRLRAQRLYYFALQFTAHPSTLAYYLTLSGNSDYAKAITGAANVNDPSSLPDLDPEEWKIVEGIQHMTLTKPSLPPRDFFAGHAQEANSWYGTDFWGSDPYTAGEALQEACCTMIAGSLAVEPRFKQVLLELLLGQEDMSVMSLGKLRVQPSANGFGFFKQGGQARVGYRNVCLNSRKFTSQLKEEIVKYAHSGLMVWWIECDDPAVVKQEIENEFLKQDAMDGAASLSASSRVPSTTATAMTQQHEVGRLNQKREALSEAVKISEADVWYPSEQTFEQFKDGIRGKKVKIISRVLRDAHRDSGKVNLSKLPFIPLDEWYTKSNSWESIEQARDRVTPDRLAELVCEHQWAELRAGIIEKAVELALDDVEQTVWDSICLEVKEKALVDSAAGLRKMVLRAGYAPYKLKLQAGDTNDAAQQRLLLDEEMFHQNEATDFAPDLSDKTLPGRQRVAGVVYDDVRKQHTICFLDEFGNYLDSFELHHLVMREEDPLVREKLDDMQIRLRKAIYTHRPAAWALGMSDSSDLRVREMLRKFNVDWQAMLEDRDLCKLLPPNFKPPKIEMVDSRIARVWARSRAAAVELRDLDESRKKAVSVGRTLRSPLSAVASLFTADMDALNLALCEMQDVAPRLPLLRRLEQQMVSIVAVVGLDINGLLKERARSEQGLVQFLPGFGPRKATGLLRSVAGTSVEIVRRHELTASPFDITPRVYRNMCGFVKVLLPHEDTDISLFAFSLDRTRIHPLFYSMVYNMALSMAVGLGKMERHAVAGLSDAEYDAKMTDVIEDMMEDVEICRKRQMIEQADLLQIEWEVMKDDWNRMYGSVGDFVSSPDAAEMFDSVRVPELMQVIRDELMQPYGLRAEPGDDLFPMAEYKPLADDAVFDTLTDDPSLQKGAVRIVSVSSTSISGVRVRIAGCDAARGLISKSETAPGSVYSESEWSLYRDQWFKKGTQLEAVVSHVVKGNFLVRLTILPDAIKSAKMKVDKSYREMEKNLRRREREALGGSQTLSQTQETASQTATLKTLSLTDDRTATSIVDSAFDNPNNAVQQDLGIALHVPEPDGGALLSHPLYIPSIETYEQAEKKLVDVEPTTGRPYFKPGELLLRPDLRTKKKTRFRLSMRLLDHPACDTRNLLGHGKNFVFAQTGFLHLAFELRGMHGGAGGVVVLEKATSDQKRQAKATTTEGEEVPDEVRVMYDDVDHMVHVHARQWFHQLVSVRAHPRWDERPFHDVQKYIAKEAQDRQKRVRTGASDPESGHIPWRFCADNAIIRPPDVPGGEPRVDFNPLRFLVVLPGVSSEEIRHGIVRTCCFEVKRTHFCLIRTPGTQIKNPQRDMHSLKEVVIMFQALYKKLIQQKEKDKANSVKGYGSSHGSGRGAVPNSRSPAFRSAYRTPDHTHSLHQQVQEV